ncbi:MAG: hypothetical protein ACR2J9_02905 [Gaiellales bacterium]
MSTRLQVILDDDELARYKACATRDGVNLSTWVRMALTLAERTRPRKTPEERMAAVKRAMDIPASARVPTPTIAELRRGFDRKYESALDA